MKSPSTASRHVLLIDPETYVWDVVRHALGEGYRVSAVAFRSAALRILTNDPPDAIIVDLMPKGLGVPLAIHGSSRQIPVVMTTSNHHLAGLLMQMGCVILRKPHSPSELRGRVDDAVTNPNNNLMRQRTALERIRANRREREVVLRFFGDVRDEVLLAVTSVHD